MLYVGVNEISLRWAIDHVRAGAEEAGRDPDTVKFSSLTAMWVSDDQEAAWDQCRWAPAACANHIADTMRRNKSHGMPETMTRLPQSRHDYDYYAGHLSSDADHTAYLTGELIDDFAIAGLWPRCAPRWAALRPRHRRDLVRVPQRGLRPDGHRRTRDHLRPPRDRPRRRRDEAHRSRRRRHVHRLTLVDEEAGRITVDKVPSTPDDPPAVSWTDPPAVRKAGVDLSQIDNLLHGTTVATNIALTHTGAEVGMITTEGMRDILHIARHKKPLNFSLQQELPWQSRPLVKRRHRLTVKERVTVPHGEVLVPLDEDEVRERVRELKAAGVEAVAVCFLHSYLNPAHEQRVKEILLEEFPEAYLSVSNEVLPLYREFERFSTVALNAYVGPEGVALRGAPRRGDAEGGLTATASSSCSPRAAWRRWRRPRSGRSTCSCPARSAGLIGGIWAGRIGGLRQRRHARHRGHVGRHRRRRRGQLRMRHLLDTKIGDYQAMVPMVDIDTIGAGGGSIAYVDRAACSASAPSRPAPTRARPATGAAERCRPRPTPSCCWAASAPTGGCSAARMGLDLELAEQAVARSRTSSG